MSADSVRPFIGGEVSGDGGREGCLDFVSGLLVTEPFSDGTGASSLSTSIASACDR